MTSGAPRATPTRARLLRERGPFRVLGALGTLGALESWGPRILGSSGRLPGAEAGEVPDKLSARH
ncbi:hypothetical protein C1708_23340 [Streptomyces sp. DH-12]|nr:hypothetical protein C1708_23340 [Streptomyces sp. DH-12]